MTVEGGTDAEVFEAFLAQVLVPRLRPSDIVVLDNLSAHKPLAVRRLVHAAGARLIFLPLSFATTPSCWEPLTIQPAAAMVADPWFASSRRWHLLPFRLPFSSHPPS